MIQIFKGAPKATLANKIYEKRNRTNTCYMLDPNAAVAHPIMPILRRCFTLTADVGIEIGAKIFQSLAGQSTYTNTNPIIESVRTLVFKKTFRKDVKKFFDFGLNLYAAYGIFQKGVDGFSEFQRHVMPKTGGRDGFMNYLSLMNYINDHSEVVPLKFVQLDYLFRIYFGVLLLFLFCNMAHYAKVRLANLFQMLKILLWFVGRTSPFGKLRVHPVDQ